jgi:predicted dehydrogenase
MKIACIGAGGIMRNAHLPAYRQCGFEIASVYDSNEETARQFAADFDVPHITTTLEDLPQTGVIYDLATPASAIPTILHQLPHGAFVLMQKPMGETLTQAEEIVALCEERQLNAAVNFQLRWAPYTLALKELIASGALGEVHDVEFKINVHTPWALWDFLEKAPRMEMVYHSIHYVDLVRDLFGEPQRVWARAIRHPDAPKLESSRSFVYLEYGDHQRATISTYHGHMAGPKHQESYLKVEGTLGVAKMQMGLNMDYPKGGPDGLEYWAQGMIDWVPVPFEGSWFPEAFRGPMLSMMAWANGGAPPSTEVRSSLLTMRLVEQAYQASDAMRG